MTAVRVPAAFLAALATALPAAAEPSPSPEAPAKTPPSKAADKDPMVCRSETPIGSKLPVKTCIRKSERDRQERDSQEALQHIQRRADGPSKERM